MDKKYFEIEHRISGEFNSYLVTGVWGGPIPGGILAMNFYRDRVPSPEKSRIPVGEKQAGVFVPEGPEEIVSRATDIFRETYVELMMNLDDARNFRDWLSQQIANAEALIGVDNAK